MLRRTIWLAVLAGGLMGASEARAQVGAGAAGAVPAAPGGPAGAAAATAAAAAGPRVGFFARMCDALDQCKRKLCAKPAGQLLNGMTAPLTTLTGGVIPPFCPIMPSEKDLAAPGVQGAKAQAMKEALEGKARRDAVRYLGTLDCRYFPDAQGALIAALRSDPIECVRLEAALALGNGCCCSKPVIDALEASVSGSDKDNNPGERSVRVRDAAYFALQRCLACYSEPVLEPVDDKKKEKPPVLREKDATGRAEPAPMPTPVQQTAALMTASVARARTTMTRYETARFGMAASSTSAPAPGALASGQKSVYHLLKFAQFGPLPTVTVGMPTSEGVVPAAAEAPMPGPAATILPTMHR